MRAALILGSEMTAMVRPHLGCQFQMPGILGDPAPGSVTCCERVRNKMNPPAPVTAASGAADPAGVSQRVAFIKV